MSCMIKGLNLLVENKMVDITKSQLYFPPIRLENVSQQLKLVCVRLKIFDVNMLPDAAAGYNGDVL